MPRDRDRPALARQAGRGEVARPVAEEAEVVVREHHRAQVELGDVEAPEGILALDLTAVGARLASDTALPTRVLRGGGLAGRGVPQLLLLESALEPLLLRPRVERGDRLLPDHRRDRVGDEQDAGDEQDREGEPAHGASG
jgi:hypothetical protein